MRRLGLMLMVAGGAVLAVGLAAFITTQLIHAEAFTMRLVTIGGLMLIGFVLVLVGLFLRNSKRRQFQADSRPEP